MRLSVGAEAARTGRARVRREGDVVEETTEARRLRPPSWRDGRLVVGVLLILASVALGVRLVAAADQRVPVFAAARTLVPGERVEAADLARVDVTLGDAAGAYLPAEGGRNFLRKGR